MQNPGRLDALQLARLASAEALPATCFMGQGLVEAVSGGLMEWSSLSPGTSLFLRQHGRGQGLG